MTVERTISSTEEITRDGVEDTREPTIRLKIAVSMIDASLIEKMAKPTAIKTSLDYRLHTHLGNRLAAL